MIRVSEAVLPGHPDKLCDFVAESIVQAAIAVDPRPTRRSRPQSGATSCGCRAGMRRGARRSTSSGSPRRRSIRSRGP